MGRRAYRFHPMDLLVQSGLLRGRARIHVTEAIGAGLGVDEALAAVAAARPELVLALVGAASEAEDAAFLARLRAALPGAVLLISGDIPQFLDDGLERFPAAHGALLDFTAPDLLDALDGGGSQIWWRGGPRPPRARQRGRFRYGLPLYEAFPQAAYRLPYHPGRVGSPLASFGCPFTCTFCNTSQVPWKVRELDDLLEEIRWLAGRGVRHVYLRDATFGVERRERRALLRALRELPQPVTWNTFSRIDLFGRRDLQELAGAGCRVLQLGLETPDEAALRALKKPLSGDRVRRGIRWAHEAGIAVCGHFMLGLPGAEPGADERTLRYALELGCDYASFNVATPRPGAPFAAGGGFLSEERARALQRRTMRRFYTDRRTLLRQLRALRSPRAAAHLARQAAAVLR